MGESAPDYWHGRQRSQPYFRAPTSPARLLALTDGVVIIGVALVMIVAGVRRAAHEQQGPTPFTGTGPDELADAVSIVVYGVWC